MNILKFSVCWRVPLIHNHPHRDRSQRAFTLVELLVVIAVIGVLLGLLLPAVQASREASRRSKCSNNLKQLALGILSYESVRMKLPLGYTNPAGSTKWHSWVPFVMPFLEESAKMKQYDFSVEWWKSPNREISMTPLRVMQCPSTPALDRIADKPESSPPNKTGFCADYFGMAGVNKEINNALSGAEQFTFNSSDASPLILRGPLFWYATDNPFNSLEQVTDGQSRTILIGECAGREDVWRIGKMTPVNYTSSPASRARGGAWLTTDNPYQIGSRTAWNDPSPIPGRLGINNSNEWGHCLYSFHPGGANVSMSDGSVHFMAADMSLRLLAELCTRAGGEPSTEF